MNHFTFKDILKDIFYSDNFVSKELPTKLTHMHKSIYSYKITDAPQDT